MQNTNTSLKIESEFKFSVQKDEFSSFDNFKKLCKISLLSDLCKNYYFKFLLIVENFLLKDLIRPKF